VAFLWCVFWCSKDKVIYCNFDPLCIVFSQFWSTLGFKVSQDWCHSRNEDGCHQVAVLCSGILLPHLVVVRNFGLIRSGVEVIKYNLLPCDGSTGSQLAFVSMHDTQHGDDVYWDDSIRQTDRQRERGRERKGWLVHGLSSRRQARLINSLSRSCIISNQPPDRRTSWRANCQDEDAA